MCTSTALLSTSFPSVQPLLDLGAGQMFPGRSNNSCSSANSLGDRVISRPFWVTRCGRFKVTPEVLDFGIVRPIYAATRP